MVNLTSCLSFFALTVPSSMTLTVIFSPSGPSRHFPYVGAMVGNLPYEGRWRCQQVPIYDEGEEHGPPVEPKPVTTNERVRGANAKQPPSTAPKPPPVAPKGAHSSLPAVPQDTDTLLATLGGTLTPPTIDGTSAPPTAADTEWQRMYVGYL